MPRPRLLARGEFPSAKAFKTKEFTPAGQIRSGALRITPYIHNAPKKGGPSQVFFIRHGRKLVGCIIQNRGREDVLMVHPRAKGELEFPSSDGPGRLTPGNAVELDRYRDYGHGFLGRGLGGGLRFSLVDASRRGSSVATDRNIHHLNFAWHPKIPWWRRGIAALGRRRKN